VRSSALLSLGRVGESLTAARKASALLASLDMEESQPFVRIVLAEALAASGDAREAAAAVAAARDSLLTEASKLRDPARRERFLRDIPEHARTLELAQVWLTEPARSAEPESRGGGAGRPAHRGRPA
jgi:eukaryotic-like serine/threonine-protein kinase